MKSYERRRKPYRGGKRTDQRSGRLLWHRMLAVLVAAVTILTGIELSGLEAVFAKETSGYQIDVSYSEGKAQAVLKGNTDSVSAGVTLSELKDEEGNTFDPSEFETTVTENGTYTYTLTYKETASQSGKQVDKEEKVSVTVDQIVTKTSETSSVSVANEAAASQQPTASEETPAALPLNVLEESLEGIRASRAASDPTINVGQYADELLTSKLTEAGYSFGGGSFATTEIPSFDQPITGIGTAIQRSFSRAGIIVSGGDESAPIFITGLYPVEKENGSGYDWYYTTENTTEQNNPYGNISAGYLLDMATMSVRFYYALDTSDTYRIGFLPSSIDFSLLVNGRSYEGAGDLVDPIQVKPGEKIVATIELPSEYQTALMALYEFDAGWSDSFTRVIASYGLVRPEDDDAIAQDKSNGTWIANAEQIASTTSTLRYQVIFEMPAQDIDIRMHNFDWDTNLVTRYYGLWINEGMPAEDREMGITRLFTRFVEGPGDNVNTNSDSALLAGTGVTTKHWATNPTYTPYTQTDWGNSGFGRITGGGGTYIHVDAYTWPWSTADPPTQMRQMKYGNLTDRTDLSDDINQDTYLNPEDTSKTTVATGNFYPGESVGFRLETARGARNYGGGHPLAWRYMPGYLTVDIYAGKGQSFTEGKNFERYYVDLSSLKQNEITRTSLGGNGEILIQCLQKDIDNWTSDWGGSFKRYNLTGDVGVPVSAYNITVNGVTRPFKIIYNHYSSVQENYRVTSMTGVEKGTVATPGIGNASNVNGSYIYLKKDQNSARQGYYPLTEEYFFIRAEKPNNGFRIGLKPSEGYSVPTITTKKADGTVITSGSNGYSLSAPTLENGRYVYTLSLSGSATAELRTMDIVAAPVSFDVEYWYNNKRYDSANLTLAYDQTENALVGLTIPSNIPQGQFFSGFALTVEGGSKAITINPASGGNWMPGDIINVRSIYQKLAEQGALSTSADYTIKLTAQTATTGGVWLNAGYTVYKQSGWFSGTEYNNTNFADRESGSVSGLAGGSVLFTGYKDQFPDGTNKYLLDEGKSTFSGSMPTSTDQNGTEIGKFYYLNAATVQIYVPTDLTDINAETTNINKWNTDNANVYYTGVQGKSNVVDLSSIMLPAEANGKELQGWRIVKGSTTTGTSEQIQVYNYEIEAGASSTLDLNTLGTTAGDTAAGGRTAWEAIFGSGSGDSRTDGSGTITLIPYYVDTMLPISSGTGTGWNDLFRPASYTDQFYGNQNLELTFDFKYDVSTREEILNSWGSEQQSRTTQAPDAMKESLDFALYSFKSTLSDSDVVKTWTLRGSAEVAGVSTKLTLGTQADSEGYATATITVTIPAASVTYQDFSNQVFYMFAWNSASEKAAGTDYEAVAHGQPNAPSTLILLDTPHSSGLYNRQQNRIAASYRYYASMVPRGIESVGGGSNIASGDDIQWKNSEGNGFRVFEVEFKYDDAVPWTDVQDVVITKDGSGNPTNNNAIRVLLFEKDSSNTWKAVQRLNQDDTFGSITSRDNNAATNGYAIELVEGITPGTFTVRVILEENTAGTVNEATVTNENVQSEFAVLAFNNQNGETDAPNSSTKLTMVSVGNDFNADEALTEGNRVPGVKRSSTIYPTGVQVQMSNDGFGLIAEETVQKYNNQESAAYSAVFTYDGAITHNMYNPTGGNNYFIGFYKSTNGTSWTLVDGYNGNTGQRITSHQDYITSVQPATPAAGQIQVGYKIPASDNDSNAQYRLMAFYGNIGGDNEVLTSPITNIEGSGMTNTIMGMANLATVNITLNNTTYNRIESASGSWNSQVRNTDRYIYADEALVLEANFKYDTRTKSAIETYWNNGQAETTETGMGYYLNWVLYGYNTTTQETSTWMVREKVVADQYITGVSPDDISVELVLGEDTDYGGESDNIGLLTIRVTIARGSVTYDNLNGQAFYLFAWNNASNSEFEAHPHTQEGDAQTPYNQFLKNQLALSNGWGNNFGTNGRVANVYWYNRVVPRPITLVGGTYSNYAGEGEEKGSVATFTSGDMSSQTFEATFAYDTTFTSENTTAWDLQKGTENSNGDNTAHPNRNTIRVALLKKDYGSTTWSRVDRVNADGDYGSYTTNQYYVELIDNGAGTFAVRVEKRTSALEASYGNYNAEYMIVAYNYQNTSTGMIGLWSTAGNLGNTMTSLVGNTLPGYKTTTEYKPGPMTQTNGGYGGHLFDHGKQQDVADTITEIHFRSSGYWKNVSGTENTEMQPLFDPEAGNMIVTLWKRTSEDINGDYTGNFSLVDTYTGGSLDSTASVPGEKDYISKVEVMSNGELEVNVQLDSGSNKGNYRVYAWYINGNGSNVYNTDNMDDESIFGDAGYNGADIGIPYADILVSDTAPSTYIYIPPYVQLFEGENTATADGSNGSKVYETNMESTDPGANISDQYAGNRVEIRYDSAYMDGEGNPIGDLTAIPMIQVDALDNFNLLDETQTPVGTVGIYFEDGYKNNTSSTYNPGMPVIGTLTFGTSVDANSNKGVNDTAGTGGVQISPQGRNLAFWLNTPLLEDGTYTGTLRFHFKNIGMNNASGTN